MQTELPHDRQNTGGIIVRKKRLSFVLIAAMAFALPGSFAFAQDTPTTERTDAVKNNFNGHSYAVYEKHMTWTDAESYCESLNGHLATVTSEAENDFLLSILTDYPDVDYMLGMNDKDDEGNWSTWVTGESADYTNWGSSEPDNSMNDQESLVICNGDRSSWNIKRGQWDDNGFSYDTYYFICEWDETAFTPKSSGWSFVNMENSFSENEGGAYYIPLERYKEVFGSSYVDAMGAKEKASIKDWDGNCFGMSEAAVLFQSGALNWSVLDALYENDFPDPNHYYDKILSNLKEQSEYYYACAGRDTKVTHIIEQYQLYGNSKVSMPDGIFDTYFAQDQADSTDSKLVYTLRGSSDNGTYVQSILTKLQDAFKTDKPYLIDMQCNDFSHIMVARTDRAPVDEGSGWWKVYVYDPNKPYVNNDILTEKTTDADHFYYSSNSLYASGEDVYMELNPSLNEWRYKTGSTGGSSEGYVGTDASGNVIDKVISNTGDGTSVHMPEFFMLLDVSANSGSASTESWLPSKAGSEVVIAYTGETSCSIYDDSDTLRAVVVNGYGEAAGNGAYCLNNCSGSEDTASTGGRVVLPAGIYHISYQQGSLSVRGDGHVISVEAEAPVKAVVDTAENKVEVSAGTAPAAASLKCTDVVTPEECSYAAAEGTIDEGKSMTLSLDEEENVSASTDSDTSIDVSRKEEAEAEPQHLKTINASSFDDVSIDDWFYEYVKYVKNHGLMTGLNPSIFAAGEDLSRAQFATILYRIEGSPEAAYSAKFPDVADGRFYSKAVIWANNAGIVTGYGNGKFGPSDNVTREQMMTMMYRYAKYKGFDTSTYSDLKSFPDAASVSPFAYDAVRWAVNVGLITGDHGNINPQGSANRGQCAAIIMRFMDHYEQ